VCYEERKREVYGRCGADDEDNIGCVSIGR